MSDLPRFSWRATLAVGLVATLVAPRLGAQRPTQYDALRDYWAARSQRASARLSALRLSEDSSVTDTTRALRFDIVTSAALAPLAADVSRLADSLVRRTWMPPRREAFARFTIHGRVLADIPADEGTLAFPSVPNRLALSVFDADGGRTELVVLDSAHPAAGAARTAVRRSTVETLVKALDPALSSWLVDRPTADLPSPLDWRQVWWALATYPSLPARGCMAGEIRSCEAALGLTGEPDPIRAWYDPSLRQVLGARGVPGWRGERLTEQQRTIVEACASGNDDTACMRFLSDTALGARLVEPGPRSARALLMRYAFSFPTDSAARAQAAYAPGLTVKDRLSRASGLPFDELVRRFHQQVSERRPSRVAPGSSLLWTSCLWCLAFGTLSLRSTRWRG